MFPTSEILTSLLTGTHLAEAIIKVSKALHLLRNFSVQSSRKVERTKGILKLVLAKILESLKLPRPKILPLALMTMKSIPSGAQPVSNYELLQTCPYI